MFDFASYHRASDIAEAVSLLARYPQAKLLAGGTDTQPFFLRQGNAS